MPDYELLTETDIKYRRKADRRNIGSKGVAPKNTEILWLDSRNLARYAKEKGNNVGLVYFKDSDGTNTAPRDRWNLMIAAMYSGFKAATFKHGCHQVFTDIMQITFDSSDDYLAYGSCCTSLQ